MVTTTEEGFQFHRKIARAFAPSLAASLCRRSRRNVVSAKAHHVASPAVRQSCVIEFS